MEDRVFRGNRDSLANEFRSRTVVAGLMCEQSKLVEGVRLAWLRRQNLPIEHLCLR